MVLVNSSGLHPCLLLQILICTYLPCVPSALLCAGGVCVGLAAPGDPGQEPSWLPSLLWCSFLMALLFIHAFWLL